MNCYKILIPYQIRSGNPPEQSSIKQPSLEFARCNVQGSRILWYVSYRPISRRRRILSIEYAQPCSHGIRLNFEQLRIALSPAAPNLEPWRSPLIVVN